MKKEDLLDLLKSLEDFSTELGALSREWGSRFTSEWEDGGDLEVRLDLLDEELDILRIGIETYIKREYECE